ALPLSQCYAAHRHLHSFPTRRSSDLSNPPPRSRPFSPSWPPLVSPPTTPSPSRPSARCPRAASPAPAAPPTGPPAPRAAPACWRSEEHTSELQSRENLVCRLLLEKKK